MLKSNRITNIKTYYYYLPLSKSPITRILHVYSKNVPFIQHSNQTVLYFCETNKNYLLTYNNKQIKTKSQ